MFKLIPNQMPTPGLERMVQPYGDSSPAGLLWTFMGASAPYTMFTGAAEVLGGLLLFFRRTTLLGALVVCGVMSNVVMLNFCYDVSVKLTSTQLLLMAIFLLVAERWRLVNFFLWNRATAPAPERVPFPHRWMERGRRAVKSVLIAVLVLTPAIGSWRDPRHTKSKPPYPALYGLYEVETFTRNQQTVPPLLTESSRWRRVIVNQYGLLAVQQVNDSIERFLMEDDPVKRTLTLSPAPGTNQMDLNQKFVLTYSRTDPDHLILEGNFLGDLISARLRRISNPTFQLSSRGFHWINEIYFNR